MIGLVFSLTDMNLLLKERGGRLCGLGGGGGMRVSVSCWSMNGGIKCEKKMMTKKCRMPSSSTVIEVVKMALTLVMIHGARLKKVG